MPFPFRLQGRHIDNDAATRIGALAKTNHQNVPGDPEIFNGSGQRKGIGRNDADILMDVHKTALVEGFGINDRRIDVGENLEFTGATDIVTIARSAIGDHPTVLPCPDLPGFERFDHAL